MKKWIAIIPVTMLIALMFARQSVSAAEVPFSDYQSAMMIYVHGYNLNNEERWEVGVYVNEVSSVINWSNTTYNGYPSYGCKYYKVNIDYPVTPYYDGFKDDWSTVPGNMAMNWMTDVSYVLIKGTWGDVPSGYTYYDSWEDFNSGPEPDEPVVGDDWLSDMWAWILWQLGFNDDYSGDLIKITGGDKVRTEIVTPTPSPTPTPAPSPTPYIINIVDNQGNPVYTITGLPSQNITINQGDNIENGSDFDIFEVDQKIGDGGAVNPRDGINDVMETNNDYIQDMDISSVQNSFSVLPADWLLMIGVLASLPFIAGFIAKLLK